MGNLEKDLEEMTRLGYGHSYGKYKLDHPGTAAESAPKKRAARAAPKPRERAAACKVCGNTFLTFRPNQLYCSDACKIRASKDRYRHRKDGPQKPSVIRCEICGKEFMQVTVFQKYCGKECQATAKRETARQWRKRQVEMVK